MLDFGTAAKAVYKGTDEAARLKTCPDTNAG